MQSIRQIDWEKLTTVTFYQYQYQIEASLFVLYQIALNCIQLN